MRKLLLICIAFIVCCQEKRPVETASETKEEEVSGLTLLQQGFQQKIDSLIPLAEQFAIANHYNPEYVFIADLSLHSGLERFAVVDLENDTIIHKGLVAHGAGGKYQARTARYSNVPNSLCSSPGKYRIGVKYNGRFGKAYKLHGLDQSNSKAFERFIVLHAYDCVPDTRLYPEYLCNSEGCPMVSYNFLDTLSRYIDKSKKPVLLWIVG